MASLARVVALIVAANTLAVVALLLFAADEAGPATGVALVTLGGFVVGLLAAASVVPHERARSAGESASLGIAFVGVGGVLALAAAILATVGDVGASVVPAVIGATTATFGVSMLNATRMLRRVPSLILPDEEPRALGLAANAMPGRARRIVVATDDRIVWAEGRRLEEMHAVRLADVDRFDIDHRTGTLSLTGHGEELLVKPVSKRELKKFEELLVSGEPTGAPS
jgi:hypothetical protein